MDGEPAPAGTALGTSPPAGLARFRAFGDRRGVWPGLARCGRWPVPPRRTGFTQLPPRQALGAALPAGWRRTRWRPPGRARWARTRAGWTGVRAQRSATGARGRWPPAGRQTIAGWLSEATAARQRKGLGSRAFWGVEAFLRHGALTANLRTGWQRRPVLPDRDLPHLGVRPVTRRVIAIPAPVRLPTAGRRGRVRPLTHPSAPRLVPRPGWQVPLPLDHLQRALADAHS